jgi:hypothetical protein
VSAKKTLDQFLQEAIAIHGSKYNYSLVEYNGAYTKIKIICPFHGIFSQSPRYHVSKRKPNGCPKCANSLRAEKTKISKSYNLEKFISLAREKHGHRYSYDTSVYKGMLNSIEITCHIHGVFSQDAHSHVYGSGCPKCGLGNNSKIEKSWLDLYNIPEGYRQYCIKVKKKKYFVDGFDPKTNTIYEFYGDFWHGNPKKFESSKINPMLNKTFGELYQMTCEREKLFVVLGYNIIGIWESDYKKESNGNLAYQ